MKKLLLIIGLLVLAELTKGQTNNCNLPDSVIDNVREALEKIYEDDQFITRGASSDSNTTQKFQIEPDSLAEKNFIIVSGILNKYGWPHM
jgi:hypothetical protein